MRTVVGLYNSFDDAQCAVQALRDANFSKEDINFIARDANGDFQRYFDSTPQGEGQNLSDGAATGAGIGAVLGGLGGLLVGLGALAIPGIGPVLAAGPIATTLIGAGAGAVGGGIVGALVDLGVPEEHAKAYAEGIRRGGTLVTVRTPDDRSDEAVHLLERCNPLDIRHQMENNWQGMENVQPMAANPAENIPVTGSDQSMDNPDLEDETDPLETNRMENIPVTGSNQSMDIPVVEEEMNIGKHTVETGGMQIESHVREEPVKKTDDFQHFDQVFRNHFDVTYPERGMDYNDLHPAYQYGYNLARDSRFSDYDWNGIEPDARAAWERRYGQGTWDTVRDAVRYAWDTTRG